MSVRQYIGARYVPKFYEFNNGVWESNKEYEPLTIVQYNSNSYTSKKTVPANIGNPSENGDYWVATGNYSAQVEEYRQEVEDYRQELNGNINEIRNLIKIENRKILCISDSYGMSDGAGGWCSKLGVAISEINGCSVYSKVHSGSGFEAQHDQFITLLESWVAENPSLVNSITDVIVCGGYNDAFYDLTEEQADSRIGAFVNKCNDTFDNALVHVGFFAYTTETDMYPKLKPCCEKYRKYATKYGAKFIENLQYVTRNSFLLADTRHPTTDGYVLIAEHILKYLVNGYADCIQKSENKRSFEVRDNFNTELFAKGYIFQEKTNGLVTVRFRPFPNPSLSQNNWGGSNYFQCPSDGNQVLTIGKFKGFTMGTGDYCNPMSVPVNLTFNDNTVKTCIPADLFIKNGDVILRLARFNAEVGLQRLYDISFAQWGFEYKIDDSM